MQLFERIIKILQDKGERKNLPHFVLKGKFSNLPSPRQKRFANETLNQRTKICNFSNVAIGL